MTTENATSPQVDRLSFASIQVRDLQRSKQFYCDVLGFEAYPESRPDAVIFKTAEDGAAFAIREPLVDLDEANRLGWGLSVWFGCDDVDALHEQVVANEATVLKPQTDSPFGRLIVVQDPDGYALTFHEYSGGGQ